MEADDGFDRLLSPLRLPCCHYDLAFTFTKLRHICDGFIVSNSRLETWRSLGEVFSNITRYGQHHMSTRLINLRHSFKGWLFVETDALDH
jgi:hypothetical protein